MSGGKIGKIMKEILKKMISRYMYIFFVLMLLSQMSCHSNLIWFDSETNTVYTVEDYPISKLYIYLKKSKLDFYITKADTLEGLPRIKLDSIGKNYEVTETTNKLLNKFLLQRRYTNIPFIPLETYEITHITIGDAASSVIYLLTDENGRVNKVMKRYEYESKLTSPKSF